MNLRKLVFAILLFFPFISLAQTATLKGSLADESGNPLKDAGISLKGTKLFTTTDDKGNFNFFEVPYGKYKLEVDPENAKDFSQDITVNKSEVDLGKFSVNAPPVVDAVQGDNIPEVELTDEELDETATQNVSSSLGASRDVFSNAIINVFSADRFSFRGYEDDNTPVFMNGVPAADLSNGRSLYNSWSGLNDVLRNRESTLGLGASGFGFGGIGGAGNINSTAVKQRKQIQASIAISNRNYDNRTMLTYGSGLMKGGWSVSLSGSRRWADEGFIPGTYYDAWGYYAGVTKMINNKHSISLTTMGAPLERGSGGTAIEEAFELSGTNYYNPNWGYQNGEKRNATVNRRFQPLTILSHEWKIDNNSSLASGISFLTGKNKRSNIDWYNAPSPRADYYRRFPSFYSENPEVAAQMEAAIRENPNLIQINWDGLFEANRNSTIEDSALGHRAHYMVYDQVADDQIINFNTVYNKIFKDFISFSSGISFQHQRSEYYKEITDLLGADYYKDVNQFATTDITQTTSYDAPNDLLHPDKAGHVGDKVGYDYFANITRFSGWAQSVFKLEQVDLFIAAELSQTSYYREGEFQNGVFADNSLGKSDTKNFFNVTAKGGATYKLNGRNYLFANGSFGTRAPYFENAFISARVRNDFVSNLGNEKVASVEGGYLLKAPRIRGRAVAYFATFNDAVQTKHFYLDLGGLSSFATYTLTNIDKTHTGIELAGEMNLVKGFSVNAVAAIGQYLYNGRPFGSLTFDNSPDSLFSNEVVYLKNFHIGNKPEQAYTLGVSYRSPQFWFANLNFNFFNNFWYEVNPLRRTSRGVDNVDADSELWNQILDQQKTSGEFTVDFFGGWSWRINNKWKSLKRNTFLVFNVGVNNILNNKNLVTAAREQLRFDFNGPSTDTEKFAPKFSHGFGTNFFISLTLRMN